MDNNMIKSDFDVFGDVEYTTDHDMIHRWISAHHGHPARLKEADTTTHGEQNTIHLRIHFPTMPSSESHLLEKISWKEFFDIFEAERLAMVFVDEHTAGKAVPSVNFVNRATAQADNAALNNPPGGQEES
jgi:hypothetical protein